MYAKVKDYLNPFWTLNFFFFLSENVALNWDTPGHFLTSFVLPSLKNRRKCNNWSLFTKHELLLYEIPWASNTSELHSSLGVLLEQQLLKQTALTRDIGLIWRRRRLTGSAAAITQHNTTQPPALSRTAGHSTAYGFHLILTRPLHYHLACGSTFQVKCTARETIANKHWVCLLIVIG